MTMHDMATRQNKQAAKRWQKESSINVAATWRPEGLPYMLKEKPPVFRAKPSGQPADGELTTDDGTD